MGPITIKPDKNQNFAWMSELSIYYIFFMGLCITPIVLNWGDPLSFYILATSFSIFFTSLLIRIPLYHKSLKYSLDEELLKLERGILWKEEISIPYSKITSMDIIQGPLERIFHLSQIHIQTASSGGLHSDEAEIRLIGIKQRDEIKKIILKKIKHETEIEKSIPA